MLNQDITPTYILQIMRRRKLSIILLTILFTTFAVIYALVLPNIYLSDTVILVEPQQSIQTTSGKPSIGMPLSRDSLATISQQILSRSHLEQIVNQYNLYSTSPMEQRVNNMRNDTKLDVVKPDYTGNVSGFKISYQHKEAKTAADVTNLLATLFIEENVSSRDDILNYRLRFLKDQTIRTKAEFDKQEKQLQVFKQKYFEKLPEQREQNLKVIEQINIQLAANNDALNRAQQQRVYLESMINQYKSVPKPIRIPTIVADLPKPESMVSEIAISPIIKKQFDDQNEKLGELQNKYTDKHPDVINAVKRVEELKQDYLAQLERVSELNRNYKTKLEQDVVDAAKRLDEVKKDIESKKDLTQSTNNNLVDNQSRDKAQEKSDLMSPEAFATVAQINSQLNSIKPEIQGRLSERSRLMNQINVYQSNLKVPPEVEQELARLTQDYNLTKETYQAILNERNTTQMSQELENKQKTKLFRVLDPAKVSEKPYKPNRRAIVLYGLLIGLGAGFGLAFYREFTDSSLYTEHDVETTLGFEVLATIPKI